MPLSIEDNRVDSDAKSFLNERLCVQREEPSVSEANFKELSP